MSEPRPMRRDATRNHETIVTAAIGVLAVSPEASMQEIADASEAGRSTIYRHFPDRAALVAAIHARVVAEADGIVEATLAAAGAADPVEVAARLAAELAGLGDRYRFLERSEPPATGEPPLSAAGRALQRYLAAAQRRDQIRTDVDARWLLDVLTAVVTQAAGRRYAARRGRAAMVTRTVESLLRPSPGG